MSTELPKFVAIVGPTATGKTALGTELALQYDGEIVCADSRTLFRGMDIGTAKPTAQEQVLVKHHILDILDPGTSLSAAAFKRLAEGAIINIASRGKIPFLIGGSGLYVDSILFDYNFPPEADVLRRRRLEAMSLGDLLELLAVVSPVAFEKIDRANRRRVIRAVETAGIEVSRRDNVVPQALVLGTMLSKEIVQKRVSERVEKMLEEGFIGEVKMIIEDYGSESSALDVIGYRAFKDYVLGTKTLLNAKDDFIRGDMALYKKQVTWFKRNPAIHWVNNAGEAASHVSRFLEE